MLWSSYVMQSCWDVLLLLPVPFILEGGWPLHWLVCLSGLSIIPQTERFLVRFPVRAHAWFAGQVLTDGCFSHTLIFLSPPPSLSHAHRHRHTKHTETQTCPHTLTYKQRKHTLSLPLELWCQLQVLPRPIFPRQTWVWATGSGSSILTVSFFNWIHGATLVRKTVQVSSVQLNKTPSAHCTVRPPPQAKSPFILLFTLMGDFMTRDWCP